MKFSAAKCEQGIDIADLALLHHLSHARLTGAFLAKIIYYKSSGDARATLFVPHLADPLHAEGKSKLLRSDS